MLRDFFLIMLTANAVMLILIAIGEKNRQIIKTRFRFTKRLVEPLKVKKSNPLTPREQIFFQLVRDVWIDHIILAQVDIKRILDPLEEKDRWKYMEEIQALSIDFVILTKNYDLLACIELDDSSHDTEKAQVRDQKKNKYLSQAKIPLVRFRAMPNKAQLMDKVETKITKLGLGTFPQSSGED